MAGDVYIEDFSQQFIADIERTLDKRMDRAAQETAAQLRTNVSGPGPAPSAPGQFPHSQSGELAASVYWSKDPNGDRIVGASSPHALILEGGSKFMAPRPFLARTFEQMWNRIQQILAGK